MRPQMDLLLCRMAHRMCPLSLGKCTRIHSCKNELADLFSNSLFFQVECPDLPTTIEDNTAVADQYSSNHPKTKY